jgi:hypothetical protein
MGLSNLFAGRVLPPRMNRALPLLYQKFVIKINAVPCLKRKKLSTLALQNFRGKCRQATGAMQKEQKDVRILGNIQMRERQEVSFERGKTPTR